MTKLLFVLLALTFYVPLAFGQEEKQEQQTESESSTDKTPAQPKLELRLPTDQFKQNQTDAQHYLVHDTLDEILVGTERYFSLVEANSSVNVKGNFIILPDWAKGLKNPKTAGFSRYMSTIGWHSLTVQVPRSPENYPSVHHTVEQREKDNQQSLADYQLLLSQLLASAVEKAKENPGPIMVIAEGQVAANIASILSQENDDIEALIMLSSYVLTNHQDNSVNTKVASVEIPILDIFLSKDNLMIASQAQQRQDAVNVELKSFYRQYQITNIQPGYYPKEDLIKAVTGWLKSIGY